MIMKGKRNPLKRDPLTGYNFCLRVDGKYDLPCKSIQSFEYGNEYEYIREGGLNDYVHIRKKQASQPRTFQVERYVGIEKTDYLEVGKSFSIPLMLFVSNKAGDFQRVARTYVFIGCTVINKKYGDMDASRSELLTETTTIAYQQLLCVNN